MEFAESSDERLLMSHEECAVLLQLLVVLISCTFPTYSLYLKIKFSDLLDELGVWMDTSSFNSFADVTTALNDIAVSADALNSDIDSIDFTIGVDACKFKKYLRKIEY